MSVSNEIPFETAVKRMSNASPASWVVVPDCVKVLKALVDTPVAVVVPLIGGLAAGQLETGCYNSAGIITCGRKTSMSKQEILAVEDDENILELVKYNLVKEGYDVCGVTSGEEALTAARSQLPHLVVLDLMLPGVDGLEVCKTLKSDPKTAHIPIVMLTAKGEEADVVAGLEVGADDYITKPFSPKVLIARIRTVLRRQHVSAIGEDATIKSDKLVIHPGRHEVLVNDKPVSLTYTEFRILHFLARQPGWVFTRYQIVDAVRKGHSVVSDRSVDVQVAALRKKLGPCGDYIQTVRNVGYRFKDSSDDPT